jgi:succinate-acetate transporter protein
MVFLWYFPLVWAVFNLFFLLASCALWVPSIYILLIRKLIFPNRNIVYIILFLGLELCLILDAASSFALGDGLVETSANLITAAGAFGFIASLAGYYCVLQSLCEDSLPFSVPMGDTSRAWKRWCRKTSPQSVKSEGDMAWKQIFVLEKLIWIIL